MSDFICHVGEELNEATREKYREACKKLGFHTEHEGEQYCVLHYPDKVKTDAFEKALKSKLRQKDYNFSATVFPDSIEEFRYFVFDATANFTAATFYNADFTGAEFTGSDEGTDFSRAKFDFSKAKFSGVTRFLGASFDGRTTSFSEAEFSGERADFSQVNFSSEQTVFVQTKFQSDRVTSFSKAKFLSSKETNFWQAKFGGEVTNFSEGKFSSEQTNFNEAEFGGKVTNFERVEWASKKTEFLRTQFGSELTFFIEAAFGGELTDFSDAVFAGEQASFSQATFSSTEYTSFQGTRFGGEATSFAQTEFSSDWTSFLGATFGAELTGFVTTKFSGRTTDFSSAEFAGSDTSFSDATFDNEVDFIHCNFRETLDFRGSEENNVFGCQSWVRFDHSRIYKPEMITFNTVLLHPGWFINVDARNVGFTDVKWYGLPNGPRGKLENEIKYLWRHNVKSPHTLLAQACRRLSANAEDNREYFLANEFHYWSMDAWRIGSWSVLYEALLREEGRREIKEREQRDIKFKDLWPPNALNVRPLLSKSARGVIWKHIRGRRRFGVINSLYWALSGYGVRAARAFWVLIGIWAAFATLYMLIDPSEFRDFGQGIGYLWQASVYSLLALARLNPQPRPEEPGLFQLLVGFEGILGPLQIALLALAIRRKVMR
jgi:uncharacterized protein YjbI with pentapeptide repeats